MIDSRKKMNQQTNQQANKTSLNSYQAESFYFSVLGSANVFFNKLSSAKPTNSRTVAPKEQSKAVNGAESE